MPFAFFTSKGTIKSLWQEYTIYSDRIELQARLFFHKIVIPLEDIHSIEVRSSIFKGVADFWSVKIDNCDFCRHVLLTRKSGLFKRIAFTPSDPEEFVDVCNSLLQRR
jgi:hypothetical protein